MTHAPRNRAWVALGIVLAAGFALLAHAAIVDGVPRSIGAALSLIPVALVGFAVARRTRYRIAVAIGLALAAAALWVGWDGLEDHFADVFFLEHAGFNLLLATVFGRTLAAGREPLCTLFARVVHGGLPPGVARYSRGVTVAWTAFFALMFTLSCAFYLGGMNAAWSLLANFVNPLAVVAMFVVEYAVRVRMLPHVQQPGILGGARAFARHFAQARAEAPR